MVSITSLIALLAATIVSGTPANLESRQPNQVFSFDLYVDCTKAQHVLSSSLFLGDAGNCFSTKIHEFGALFINYEQQPSGQTCNIYTYNGLGCIGATQGPFHSTTGGPTSCDASHHGYPISPSAVSWQLICS